MKRDIGSTGDKLNRALGDLETYIAKGSGPFKDEIQRQIELLKIGGQTLDEFMRKVGDWKVATEDGVTTVRQMLDKAGADVRGFSDDIRKLAEEIRTGSKKVGDGLQFLKDKGGALTAQFVAMVEAFQRGEISLERVKAALGALEKLAGPGSALADVGGAILDGFNNGRI